MGWVRRTAVHVQQGNARRRCDGPRGKGIGELETCRQDGRFSTEDWQVVARYLDGRAETVGAVPSNDLRRVSLCGILNRRGDDGRATHHDDALWLEPPQLRLGRSIQSRSPGQQHRTPDEHRLRQLPKNRDS
jgi:hypothetical protein